MMYYYLGDLERAFYYHNRMWKGVLEDIKSTARAISKHLLDKRRSNISHRISGEFDKDIAVSHSGKLLVNISEDDDDPPSPRATTVEGQIKLLPFFKPKNKDIITLFERRQGLNKQR